ncbi:Cyclin-dependent kinase 2-associated protein 2 [Camelus dromedarius]|uniref:Cyclin-dependent kinase 2-associated protein 2 n=1 Tax=Camelus dromedarius TaxID=9838 RepID=A0A5N4BYL1_CAMDR|nr:Cyclin-dependent kinase 2-associated protein 2 [Camelus dromedarius]
MRPEEGACVDRGQVAEPVKGVGDVLQTHRPRPQQHPWLQHPWARHPGPYREWCESGRRLERRDEASLPLADLLLLHVAAGSVPSPSGSVPGAAAPFRPLFNDFGPPSMGYVQAMKPPGAQGSQSTYTDLLSVIEEMGKEIRPTYAGSKSAMERLKRGIIHARALVRECLAETERNART